MEKIGWLVNDQLSPIKDVRFFWHDLLDWIPNLVDKTGGYTNFEKLTKKIENDFDAAEIKPDYIIRNASYFSKINRDIKTINILQDILPGEGKTRQLEVCQNSYLTVFNSQYTRDCYKEIKSEHRIIPWGIDFDFFKPLGNKEELKKKYNILDNSILFIGSTSPVKGFKYVINLIMERKFNFCLVMKNTFEFNMPNCRIFKKIPHEQLLEVMNACSMLLCLSPIETQHLAGLEAAACGLPIIGRNTGIYYNRESGPWGINLDKDNYTLQSSKLFNCYGRSAYVKDEGIDFQKLDKDIKFILDNPQNFSPREYFLKERFDKNTCKNSWLDIVNNI